MNEEPVFKPYGFNKEKLLRMMAELQLDGILLTTPENVFYTTGFTVLPSNGNPILYTLRNVLPFYSYISRHGQITLLCWGFATLGVEFGVDTIRGFSSYEEAEHTLASHLQEELTPGNRLGIESACSWKIRDLLESSVSPLHLVAVDGLLSELRLIKSAAEIELLRKSTEIIETTLSELYSQVYIGMSRLDLMREARARLFKNGATGISHLTFSFGRANPEIAIGEKLGPNQLVTLDLGGIYKGYASDNRRYVYTGLIPPALLERYHQMVAIVDTIGETLTPGAKYSDIFQIAVEEYRRHGIPHIGAFNHVGHNIGLETEEEWLVDDAGKSVREGMVINIELYSTAPTGEYIGNEETYIISSTGSTRISELPREIRVIK